MNIPVIPLAGALALLAAPAFAQQTPEAEAGETTAAATFIGLDGQDLGEVTLTGTPEGVLIEGEVSGLPPSGEHGFHVHETGTCDPATGFESAGDHFNPEDSDHGHLTEDGPHAGDLVNQTVDEDGVMRISVTNAMVTLGGGEADLLDGDGTALVIHAEADDYVSQPGGEAGDRIACAVVEAATEDAQAEG